MIETAAASGFFPTLLTFSVAAARCLGVLGCAGDQKHTSFVAVIAAAGFAIGLAFQGSLANFAGGVLLLTFRPFGVGDFIEASGYSGTVQAIQILYTELVTPVSDRTWSAIWSVAIALHPPTKDVTST